MGEVTPAFPTTPHYHRDGDRQYFYAGHYGMTLRDYFAAKALQGFCALPDIDTEGRDIGDMAEAAYLLADAMLKAREGT
jgi:hypothetical protein